MLSLLRLLVISSQQASKSLMLNRQNSVHRPERILDYGRRWRLYYLLSL
jgi:hypothetical protein